MFTSPFRSVFGADGYRVYRGVVSRAAIERAVAAICEFTGVDVDDRETWYRLPAENAGIVPLHHAQAFWDNRQDPAVYEVFADIYGHGELWVTMDRAGFRPPMRKGQAEPHEDGWHESRGNIHWDADPRKPHPGWVQGVLLLSDTPAEAGGFQCVPSIYAELDDWLAAHPDFNHQRPDISGHDIVPVTGKAGDLIVWDSFLPHGPADNRASVPRLAQYVTMVPLSAIRDIDEERAIRCGLVEQRRPPEYWRGLVGQNDPEPGPAVELTALGRKLVGYDRW